MRRLVVTAGLGTVGPGTVGLVLAGLVLAGCAQQPVDTGSFGGRPPTTGPVGISSLPVPSPTSPKLSPQAKTALDQARRDGARTVGLTVSTEPGKADEVAAAVDRLGGTVETTDAAIGYVRLTVPVELAEEVTSVEGVSRVDVDEPLSNIDPTP